MRTAGDHSEPEAHASYFNTTHWSVVLAAGRCDMSGSAAALEELCKTYWYPLYAYVRRRGYSPEDAQDLTQEFFARLLAKEYLASAEPQKGKFRSFLLAGLNHLLSDERDKAHALKRGGGVLPVSFDAQTAEARYRLEPVDAMTPERLFERSWAAAVLEQAARRLRAEYLAAGQGRLYEQLIEFRQDSDGHRAYEEVSASLGMSISAVKSAIFRFRQRHHHLVREEIARTLNNPVELDEEIRHLLQVVTT